MGLFSFFSCQTTREENILLYETNNQDLIKEVFMRELKHEEMKKRGCTYCADHKRKRQIGTGLNYEKKKDLCPYHECPYHELDECDTYAEYLKSKGLKKLGSFDLE